MWIQTQNKQRIINSDHVIDIFISNTGTRIIATITCNGPDAPGVVLGEYKDRDTCLKVLEHISVGFGSKLPGIPMPFGEDVETWADGIDKVAAIYIANEVVKF